MFENRFPSATDFLDVFSAIGEYDPDLATYKYILSAKDGAYIELLFSINDLSTTIFLYDVNNVRVFSFYNEFVKFISIDKAQRQMFLSIEMSENVDQSVIIKLKDTVVIEISALKS